MPAYVYLASAAVVASMFLLWYAVGGARIPSVKLARGGRSDVLTPHDLREVDLARSARERLVEPGVAALANRARRLTPQGMLESLGRRILQAGMAANWPIERVLASKLVLGLLGALLGLFLIAGGPTAGTLLLAAGAIVLGFFAPDIILYGRAQERQQVIQRELPDVMDQITISVEAGLGFEAAMAQVARSGKGPLGEELGRTLQDIQIGVARTVALTNLLDRADVPELRHFVVAVRQAERYGVPIAHVLRVQSRELREKRRQRAEEQAMKVPVKIVFPVVFCILPALFVVIMGPAVIQLYENFINR